MSHGYDPLLRPILTTLRQPVGGVFAKIVEWSYTYNPAGQLASVSRDNDAFAWTSHANADRNYTANGLNQYTAAGAAAFCYDLNGNLTADGSSVYRSLRQAQGSRVPRTGWSSGGCRARAIPTARR